MTIQNPLNPNRHIHGGKTTTTNNITSELRIPNPQPQESPKSNLVILSVAALIVGFILVFTAGFVAAIPFYACGFATILSSIVLAILSLRE